MTRAARSTGPGRPKDPEKRQAILDAAKRLFPAHGFEGVSMDAIAADAGVSKLTVYSHFRDKDTLFRAAIEARCNELMPLAIFDRPVGPGGLRAHLIDIALAFRALINSEESMAMHRMLAAQAGAPAHAHAHQLAQLFFEAGARPTLDAFEALLRRVTGQGQLRIPSIPDATEQFIAMAKGLSHLRMLIGCCEQAPDPAEHRRQIESAVDMFLRAYRPD